MSGDYLRTQDACERFALSRWTLIRWANAGLISRTRKGRITRYRASDIEELLAAHTTARTVIPMAAKPEDARPEPDWRDADLWATAIRRRAGRSR